MSEERAHARKGLLWTGGAQLLTRGVDIVSTILILRHLTGVQLGVASIAGAIGMIVEAIGCFGVPTALIRSKDLDQDRASTLFWFCTALGVLGAGLLVLISPWVAGAYGYPELAPMIGVFGVKLVPLWAGVVPQQMMLRELQFHRASVTQVLPVLFEAGVKIVGVLSGLGAWALVLAHVMRGVSFFAIAFWMSGFRPRLHYRTAELVPFLRFGFWASLATVATEAYKNLDYLLVGRFFGMQVLGVYRVAFDLAMSPADAVAQPIYRVTYPLMSRFGDSRERLQRIFYQASADMVNFVLPVTLLVAFSADDLLKTIAGGRWDEAHQLIPWLCAAAVMRSVTRLFNVLFFAADLPRFGVGDALGTLFLLLILMPGLIVLTGDQLGVLSVGLAWVAVYPVVFTGLFLLARGRVGIRLADYGSHVMPGLKAGALLLPILYICSTTVSRMDLPPWVRAAAVIVPGGLFCLWLTRRFRRRSDAPGAVQ